MISIAKPKIEEEERKLIKEVLDSGNLAQGSKVKELEEKFAKLCGVRYAIAVNSGTSALHTSLFASGIEEGDEVITTPFSFIATANSIVMQKAKPVFVDIKEDTFNINPDKIEEKITPKTKAILVVDLYGQLVDYEKIEEIAKKNNLLLICDSCQSVNACLNDKKAGSFGDIAAFSFYATKNMISGEGGMITTNNEKFAKSARRFRNHGQTENRYEYQGMGYNYRMMDLQAAIALGQMEKIEEFTRKRIENALLLNNGLNQIENITIPFVKSNVKHVFHQYTIKVDENKREELEKYLKENEIGYGIYYPKPLHLYPFFIKMGYKEGDFPISERMSKQVLSLPVHPYLTKEEINKIIKIIGDFFEKN